MEFNISYYNGFGNPDELENSIKAAYLYADNIKLYDNLFTICPFLESLSKSPWLNDPFWLHISKIDFVKDLDLLYSDIEISKLSDHNFKLLNEYLLLALLRIHEEIFFRFYHYKYIEEITHSDIFKLAKIQHVKMEKVNYINDIIDACIIEIMSSNDFRMINKDYQYLFSNSKQYKSNNLNVVNFANYILTRLPAFDIATVDEIIDIKKELSKHIIPFRKAIFNLSENLSNIPEEDYESVCRKIYHAEIAPKVNEIEQAIRDNHIFKNIAANISTDPEFWAGVGSFTVACTNGNNILSSISAAGSIGLLGVSLGKAIQEHRENIKNIKSNELFFYYEVGQKIKK